MLQKATLGVVAAALLTLGGCVFENRAATLLSGAGKIATGAMGDLTSTEVLVLSEEISNVVPGVPALTAEEAAVIVEFLAANNLNTPGDVEALIAQAEADPGSIVIPEGLEDLIGNYEGVEPPNPEDLAFLGF